MGLGRLILGLWVIGLPATPVLAQAAPDAGTGRAANEPPQDRRVSASKGRAHSPFFPKLIGAPALLSEKVRAKLEERARSRAIEQAAAGHIEPGSARATAPLADSPLAEPAGIETVEPRVMGDDVRSRRMVAFETDEGITVLSNHARDVPTPVRAIAKSAPLGVEAEPVVVADHRPMTETRGLHARTDAARRSAGATTASIIESGLVWWGVAGAASVGLALVWFMRRRGGA